MLEEVPELIDEPIDESSDEIIGWNARRLHSADEILAQKCVNTGLSLKTSNKVNNFPKVRNQRQYKIKPKVNSRNLNPAQIFLSPNSVVNNNFLRYNKLQKKLWKDPAEVSIKNNRLSPDKRLSEDIKPYQLFKSLNLDQFLTRTKLNKRRNSLKDNTSPVQTRYKKYNLLLNPFV